MPRTSAEHCNDLLEVAQVIETSQELLIERWCQVLLSGSEWRPAQALDGPVILNVLPDLLQELVANIREADEPTGIPSSWAVQLGRWRAELDVRMPHRSSWPVIAMGEIIRLRPLLEARLQDVGRPLGGVAAKRIYRLLDELMLHLQELHVQNSAHEALRSDEKLQYFRVLADAGVQLAVAQDWSSLVARAVELVLPDFADGCIVTWLQADKGHRCVASAHVQPALDAELRDRLQEGGLEPEAAH